MEKRFKYLLIGLIGLVVIYYILTRETPGEPPSEPDDPESIDDERLKELLDDAPEGFFDEETTSTFEKMLKYPDDPSKWWTKNVITCYSKNPC